MKFSLNLFFKLGSYPDYLIIGAQKGGTTSLQKYLEQHPSVLAPLRKEIHFFDKKYEKGLRWYKTCFPVFKFLRRKIVGEASPYYIYHPSVAKRVFESIPNSKIIILLRDPVQRAISHYKMEFNRGNESLSFEEAIKKEPKRLKDEYKKIESGQNSWEHQYHSYLDRGKYINQLKIWFKYFDKDKILIVKSEDLLSNTQFELEKIFKFLGIKDYKLPRISLYNEGQKNIGIQEETEKDLYSFFDGYNKNLYKFLDRDFGWR